MTTELFLKKTVRLRKWWIVAAIAFALLMLAGIVYVRGERLLLDWGFRAQFLLEAILAPMGAFIVAIYCGSWHCRRFAKRYPEMKFLDAWKATGRPAKNYPATIEDKQRLIPEVAHETVRLAKIVTYMIAFRAEAKAEADAATGDDKVALEDIHSLVGNIVENCNRQYLSHWDLFVTNLRVLTGAKYRHPKVFRESLSREA